MDQPSATWAALFRGRLAAYTALMTLAVGAHAIGIHMRNTVMPSVVDDIGGAAYYTWAMMLYTMASIMATACGGRLQGALGIRKAYLIGCAVVLGGALGCAAASGIVVFLVASAIQGLGSGLLVSLGYAMVGAFYPEALRSRILSASSGIWGLAAFLGPTLGGLFAGLGWWRGAFWCFFPGLLALSLLAWYALPPAHEAQPVKRLPGLRLALLAAGVIAIASSGRVDPLGARLALLIGAGMLAGLTFHLDTRAADRLFPSRPLSLMTAVGVASWMFAMFGMTTGQVTVFMPLVAQTLYGVSPLGAGYFTAILSFSWTILALCSAGWQGPSRPPRRRARPRGDHHWRHRLGPQRRRWPALAPRPLLSSDRRRYWRVLRPYQQLVHCRRPRRRRGAHRLIDSDVAIARHRLWRLHRRARRQYGRAGEQRLASRGGRRRRVGVHAQHPGPHGPHAPGAAPRAAASAGATGVLGHAALMEGGSHGAANFLSVLHGKDIGKQVCDPRLPFLRHVQIA